MSKPICVIKIDENTSLGMSGQKINIRRVQEFMEAKLNDYHVFVIPILSPTEYSLEPIQFQVFYEKDFTEIQYAELKKIITDSLESQTPKTEPQY